MFVSLVEQFSRSDSHFDDLYSEYVTFRMAGYCLQWDSTLGASLTSYAYHRVRSGILYSLTVDKKWSGEEIKPEHRVTNDSDQQMVDIKDQCELLLAKLPSTLDRDIVQWVVGGYTFKEVAEHITNTVERVSVTHVKRRYAKCLEILRT